METSQLYEIAAVIDDPRTSRLVTAHREGSTLTVDDIASALCGVAELWTLTRTGDRLLLAEALIPGRDELLRDEQIDQLGETMRLADKMLLGLADPATIFADALITESTEPAYRRRAVDALRRVAHDTAVGMIPPGHPLLIPAPRDTQ